MGFYAKLRGKRSQLLRRIDGLSSTFEGRRDGEFTTPDKLRRRKMFAHSLYNFLFSALTALCLIQSDPISRIPLFIPKTGEVAEMDIISPVTADIDSSSLSKEAGSEVTNSVPPVFDYDDMALDSWLRRWELAFNKIRSEFYEPKQPYSKLNPPPGLGVRITFLTGQVLAPKHILFLHQYRFSESIERSFMDLGKLLLGRIISPSNLFPTYYNTGVQIRLLNQSMRETVVHDVSRIWSVEQARDYLGRLPGPVNGANPESFIPLVDIVSGLVIPNLAYNQTLTQKRLQRAMVTGRERTFSIKKGQVLARKGEQITDEQSELLTRIADMASGASSNRRFFLSLGLLFVFFTVLFRLNITGRAFWNLTLKDAIIFMLITLVAFLSARFALAYLRTLFAPLNLGFGPEYLIPISAGAIIINLMMGKEIAFTYATLTSIVIGYLLEQNFYFTVYSFAVAAAAIQSIRSCRQRTDLYRAGAWSGLVGALLVACFALSQSMGMKTINWGVIGLTVCTAFASGMLSAIITSTLIPVFETFFNYTTSLKLLELSNFNHPLLHNLMMKAPGTYHHSVIVGSLAELAADQVKANSLLARVGSYYHDIGKMTKPLYFIENQSPNSNPHDHLQPTMSAKILFAHVKNGVRMGREYKLGKPIVNIIEQHHGTTLVSFFFNKAKKAEDASMHVVSESQFRYPGPKPQSREAAIVMLADACEAATRSIAEPTPAKIQTMVHNIVTKRLLEEQFSECDLTLKDIALIEDCFVRTLVSLYHHRIVYPDHPQPAPSNRPQPLVSSLK